MRKNCETCKHDDAEFSCYPHKTPCNECLHGKGCNDAPTKWEAAEHYKPDTNADRIRSMSDEELAAAIAEKAYTGACNDFDIPHNGKCCGDCEKCDAIINWLKQPAE